MSTWTLRRVGFRENSLIKGCRAPSVLVFDRKPEAMGWGSVYGFGKAKAGMRPPCFWSLRHLDVVEEEVVVAARFHQGTEKRRPTEPGFQNNSKEWPEY